MTTKRLRHSIRRTIGRPRVADDMGISLLGLVDITERIRSQEMLQRVQADFAHAARISVLGELTASIAHELTQPLTAIAANGQAGLRWLERSVPNLTMLREGTLRMLEDSGPGIAPKNLNRIFDSFFTTKPNGMGMGLPICQSIIDAHGGRIAGDNTSAHGSARFYFYLPCAAP
jgi:signal transduction histidine kinase